MTIIYPTSYAILYTANCECYLCHSHYHMSVVPAACASAASVSCVSSTLDTITLIGGVLTVKTDAYIYTDPSIPNV